MRFSNRAPKLPGYRPDAIIEIRSPDGTKADILVEGKRRLTGQQAAELAPRLAAATRAAGSAAGLLVTTFLSPIARQRLGTAGLSYLDLTGNARVAIDRPSLLVVTQGAEKDPEPPRRGAKSLKGPKAARLVRALCDWQPPIGVRELARRARIDPGYATRVLALLEQEDIVARDKGGGVAEVRWRDLLARWTQDYQVAVTSRAATFLAPRGINAFLLRLTSYTGRWALTGSFAVPESVAISPGRVASCYVALAEGAAGELDLRPTDIGANVILLEPFDPVVLDRLREEAGLKKVALSQCAVDLMTGTGREPSEAANLLTWMESNEPAWRA